MFETEVPQRGPGSEPGGGMRASAGHNANTNCDNVLTKTPKIFLQHGIFPLAPLPTPLGRLGLNNNNNNNTFI